MAPKKRGYSRNWTVNPKTKKAYLLDDIPPAFWAIIRRKARREGTSMRALILGLLERWANIPRPGSKPKQARRAPLPAASEPHVIGTDPPTAENDPVGRFRGGTSGEV